MKLDEARDVMAGVLAEAIRGGRLSADLKLDGVGPADSVMDWPGVSKSLAGSVLRTRTLTLAARVEEILGPGWKVKIEAWTLQATRTQPTEAGL